MKTKRTPFFLEDNDGSLKKIVQETAQKTGRKLHQAAKDSMLIGAMLLEEYDAMQKVARETMMASLKKEWRARSGSNRDASDPKSHESGFMHSIRRTRAAGRQMVADVASVIKAGNLVERHAV